MATLVAALVAIVGGVLLVGAIVGDNDSGILAWLIIYALCTFFRAATIGYHLVFALIGPHQGWRDYDPAHVWLHFWVNLILFPVDVSASLKCSERDRRKCMYVHVQFYCILATIGLFKYTRQPDQLNPSGNLY